MQAEQPETKADLAATSRTKLRRKADRGRYDWASVAGTLDEGTVAHVGFVGDQGVTVIPMVYGRVGDQLYLHGAIGNAMLRRLSDGIDVCVTVTIVDAHVLSRSAFHHSMNYRSVVAFGEATLVEDRDEKHRALRAVVDHNLPGRSDECRGPNESELRATRVIRVPITEASAKVRSGPPIEEPEDLELPYWGGEVPLVLTRGTPVADEFVAPDTPAPSYG